MFKLKEKPTVFFDVDSTLVFAQSDLSNDDMFKELYPIDIFINNEIFRIHKIHIKKIKEFKARGHNVVVWSAGGSDWAETVVKALKLEEFVDVVMEKPRWYFDDKPVTEWIGDLCYVPY